MFDVLFGNAFDNVGGKIKGGIEKSFCRECIAAATAGAAIMLLLLIAGNPLGLLLGPLVTGVLIWFSYRSKLKLYAFGQMVEDLDILAGRLTLAGIQGEDPNGEFRPKTVRIICGNCECEYQGQPNDGKGCPSCGSTFRIYPQDEDK